MPTNFHVFLNAQRLPTAAQWARSIRDFGFATQLTTQFDPLTISGYVPCPDDRIGFELYREYFSKGNVELSEAALPVIDHRDTVVTFRASERDMDVEAASAAAATLAAISDGVLLDDQSGHFVASVAAIAWARDERYEPIATLRQRARRRRRKPHIRRATFLRLLVLLAAVACILFLW